MFYRIVSLIAIFLLSAERVGESNTHLVKNDIEPKFELLYDDVWGSIYHAEIRQCDSTPTITANGGKINPNHASKHRWIAISQEMLNDEYRASLVESNCRRFRGKIEYGDTIWIESPHTEINGWWVVYDAKNKRYTRSIDFLQTKGDESLFNANKSWSGKFIDIKIYRIVNYNYRELEKIAQL